MKSKSRSIFKSLLLSIVFNFVLINSNFCQDKISDSLNIISKSKADAKSFYSYKNDNLYFRPGIIFNKVAFIYDAELEFSLTNIFGVMAGFSSTKFKNTDRYPSYLYKFKPYYAGYVGINAHTGRLFKSKYIDISPGIIYSKIFENDYGFDDISAWTGNMNLNIYLDKNIGVYLRAAKPLYRYTEFAFGAGIILKTNNLIKSNKINLSR